MSKLSISSVELIRFRRRRRARILFVLLISTLLIVFYLWLAGRLASPQPLEVIFCDVGQGDAALIKTPFGQIIVIDGGPDGSALKCLGENIPFWRRQIDFVILSHYHDDHVSGLPELARRYQINNFIYAPDDYYSAPRVELIKYLNRKKGRITELLARGAIDLGKDCRLEFLNPVSLLVSKNGNNSVVTRLQCLETAFLFSGDNEVGVENSLLASNFDFSADVFKASHHGSKTSNTKEFLLAGGFTELVISVGSNKFGHPSPEVLERAQDLGLKIRRTDQEGTVKFISY